MAIKIYEEFAPFANPGDTNYPDGSIKDDSTPGAEDGTPLSAVWGNDYAGFDAALFAETGIVPTGDADTVLSSQRLDALKLLPAVNSVNQAFSYKTLTEATAGELLPVGKVITVEERTTGNGGGGTWRVYAAGTFATTSYIVNHDTLPIQFVLRVDETLDFRQLGAVLDGADVLPIWSDFILLLSASSAKGVVYGDGNFLTSDTLNIQLPSVTIEWIEGQGIIKLSQNSSTGSVIGIGAALATDSPLENVTLYNPQTDGSSFGWPAGDVYGNNGVSGSNVKHIRVYGGHARNCYHGTNSPTATGGKGIQMENGVFDVHVDGYMSENCSIAMESGGIVDLGVVPPVSNFRSSALVKYTNMIAKNCSRLVSLQHQNSPPDVGIPTNAIHIDGITAYDCGRETEPAYNYYDFSLIYSDRANNCVVENVVCYNSPGYGPIGSVVKQFRGENNLFDVKLYGECSNQVSHQQSPTAGSSGNLQKNIYRVKVFGGAAIGIYSNVAVPALADCQYFIEADSFSGTLIQPVIGSNLTCHAHFRQGNTDVIGRFNNIIANTTNSAISGVHEYADGLKVIDVSFAKGGSGNIISTIKDVDLVLNRNGATRMSLTDRGVAIFNLPTATTGLQSGDIWNNGGVLTKV